MFHQKLCLRASMQRTQVPFSFVLGWDEKNRYYEMQLLKNFFFIEFSAKPIRDGEHPFRNSFRAKSELSWKFSKTFSAFSCNYRYRSQYPEDKTPLFNFTHHCHYILRIRLRKILNFKGIFFKYILYAFYRKIGILWWRRIFKATAPIFPYSRFFSVSALREITLICRSLKGFPFTKLLPVCFSARKASLITLRYFVVVTFCPSDSGFWPYDILSWHRKCILTDN